MLRSYEEALAFLFPRTTTIKFGLATTRALLEAVGNPQDVFPTIHIGGTNGKGSVSTLCAMASSCMADSVPAVLAPIGPA